MSKAGSTEKLSKDSTSSSVNRASSATSIVLEQNGEKKILKKIKLKGPLKAPPAAKPEQTFACTFCKATFTNHEQLRVHFLKHGAESILSKNPDEPRQSNQEGAIMLIECEWCPETFTSMSKAIEHKYRKHNYESKNYFCTLCGRLFPLKVALDQHQNLEHKNDKKIIPRLDFICGFCGTAFISNSALELHIKTAHNLEKRMMNHPFIPTPSKKVRLNQAGEIISIYYCHLCGSEYMLKFNLLKHIEDHHSYEVRCAAPEDLLKCSTCDSVFYTKKAFDTHNIHHKPEDLYATSEEHRLNIVARVDQDFDFRRVPSAIDKVLGTLSGASSTDSPAVLVKKHSSKANKKSKMTGESAAGRCKAKRSKVTVSEAEVKDLINQMNTTGEEHHATGLEALSFLLGEG
ncbi:telomere zinc finger-associated protein-like isoform X2 [Topomyia yanbarensis]|uniref:telomere zinc finger-associated protein-like isoform X2 n=1 Tax=Topomyia yanbarensis TaxID=2498891 RepID=UPI00273AECF7|nr:telomere zinc finger-associated protein-like isoform X2 [Topomyia yanbarensis]